MFSLRLVVLFLHVAAVIVALGSSLFSTFALTPVLAEELDPATRIRVARRVIQRLGAIVMTSLAVLVVTGLLNVLFIHGVSMLLLIKLTLVVMVIGLAALPIRKYRSANLATLCGRPESGDRGAAGAFPKDRTDGRNDRVADRLPVARTDPRRRRDSLKFDAPKKIAAQNPTMDALDYRPRNFSRDRHDAELWRGCAYRGAIS